MMEDSSRGVVGWIAFCFFNYGHTLRPWCLLFPHEICFVFRVCLTFKNALQHWECLHMKYLRMVAYQVPMNATMKIPSWVRAQQWMLWNDVSQEFKVISSLFTWCNQHKLISCKNKWSMRPKVLLVCLHSLVSCIIEEELSCGMARLISR